MPKKVGWCAYCGEWRVLTRDHVIPLARNGPNEPSNILYVCRKCNTAKAWLTLAEWKRGCENKQWTWKQELNASKFIDASPDYIYYWNCLQRQSSKTK